MFIISHNRGKKKAIFTKLCHDRVQSFALINIVEINEIHHSSGICDSIIKITIKITIPGLEKSLRSYFAPSKMTELSLFKKSWVCQKFRQLFEINGIQIKNFNSVKNRASSFFERARILKVLTPGFHTVKRKFFCFLAKLTGINWSCFLSIEYANA